MHLVDMQINFVNLEQIQLSVDLAGSVYMHKAGKAMGKQDYCKI